MTDDSHIIKVRGPELLQYLTGGQVIPTKRVLLCERCDKTYEVAAVTDQSHYMICPKCAAQ